MSGDHGSTIDGAAHNGQNFAAGTAEQSDARLPVESSTPKCRGNPMEILHKKRCLCPSQYHPNLLSWIVANILVLFMVSRDGDLRIEDEFTLGIRCTEKSRYSTDAVVILVFWILVVSQSRTR